MPITSYDRSKRNTTDLVFGPVNTTGYLFDDDDQPSSLTKSNKTSPPDIKTYLQVQHTADGFPKLIRREENGDISVSTASAALDLASSSDNHQQQATDRVAATRHRISLPPSTLGGNMNIAPMNSILANANDGGRSAAANRRSVEVHFTADTKRPLLASPPSRLANGSQLPMSSYSTNDIPTLKSINGDGSEGGVPLNSPSIQSSVLANATSPEQIPSVLSRFSSISNHQSQDYTTKPDELQEAFNHAQSSLQASATPFGPGQQDNQGQSYASPNMTPFSQPGAFYGGYPMQMMNNGFNNMSISGANGYGMQNQWPSQINSPYQQNNFGGYQQPYQQNGQAGPGAGRFDNQRGNSVQQRRQAAEDAQNKFNSIKVEQLVGEIYTLCKDQHGCRFLQRKLEEHNEQAVQIIFDEVKHHMIDLMTDPFGNYLCQKLLESVDDEQRTVLIKSAMPSMVQIALNQHGTRALQKMIEFIHTPEQTDLIIEALGNDVVLLIQDLNGNHVIQKCLNHLSSIDATFIFNAVGAHCITVGTHRHGCCVLQRCIDHADGLQKGQMVDHVIRNAYPLIQDPFGNYVVQYILDLSEPCFTEPLCRAFYGEIATLSRQKFSSNVIEKCIRCASPETRREIITELMSTQTLEKLLRDGFANYVIQTAMDFADDEVKPLLVENVRMILPSIRNTPHGRRIQSKITDYDNRHSNPAATALSSLETGNSPAGTSYPGPEPTTAPSRANRHAMFGAPPQWASNGGDFSAGGYDGGNLAAGYAVEGLVSPTPHRSSQSFGMFTGAVQNFQNGYPSAPGFSGPMRQPFGHF